MKNLIENLWLRIDNLNQQKETINKLWIRNKE